MRSVGRALCALLVTIVGCAGGQSDLPEGAFHASGEFLIGPEDVLEVVVWKNEDLSRSAVIVRPDGMISMPLVGDVRAIGLTAEQLSAEIAEGFRHYMESPTVSVSVTEINSYAVYVLGEVNAPGKYQLKSYATVLQAIALAGGFTQFASKNSIQVIRNSMNGHKQAREFHIPVRYDDLLSGRGMVGNVVLQSGDVVVVP